MEVSKLLERIELGEDSTKRLFQESQKIHADELVIHGSKIDDVDSKALNDYYEKEYGEDIDKQDIDKNQILDNLYLVFGKSRSIDFGWSFVVWEKTAGKETNVYNKGS